MMLKLSGEEVSSSSRMLTNSAPPAQSKAGATFFERSFRDDRLGLRNGTSDTQNSERGPPTLLRDTHSIGSVTTELFQIDFGPAWESSRGGGHALLADGTTFLGEIPEMAAG